MSRSRSPRHIDDLLHRRNRARPPGAEQRPDLRTQLVQAGLLIASPVSPTCAGSEVTDTPRTGSPAGSEDVGQ